MARDCRTECQLISREFLQTLTHIHKGAAIVICRLPNNSLVLGERCAVSLCKVIKAVKLRINLMLLNELPLLKKPLEIHARFLAVPLVHEQQGIEPFHLDPPAFSPCVQSSGLPCGEGLRPSRA